MCAALLRNPRTPPAVTFRNIRLPAPPRANRAVTKAATRRTLERLREGIECQLWVPVLRTMSSESVTVSRGCRAYRFSMQFLQKNFRHGSPLDATIFVQRILGRSVVHLQWWQNVGCPDVDDDDIIRRRFLGRASRTAGADIACTRGLSSMPSSSPSARALRQVFFRILAPPAAAASPTLIGDSTRVSIDAARLLPLPLPLPNPDGGGKSSSLVL